MKNGSTGCKKLRERMRRAQREQSGRRGTVEAQASAPPDGGQARDTKGQKRMELKERRQPWVQGTL